MKRCRRQDIIGFYTDEQKRVRPITRRKGRLHAAVTRVRVKSSRSRRRRSRASWAEYATAAQVMELSRYLGGYLSGKSPKISFADGGVFSTDGENIYIPYWPEFKLPLEGFDRWRIYRHGLWHESMHLRFTPPWIMQLHRLPLEGPLISLPANYIQLLINVLEDKRIEDLGVRYYRGALAERLYTQAYAYAMRPRVETLQWNPLAQAMEAFLQRLLIGRVKGKLPPDLEKRVEEAARYAEKALKRLEDRYPNPPRTPEEEAEIVKGIVRIARRVVEKLDVRNLRRETFNKPPPSKSDLNELPKGLSRRDRAMAKKFIEECEKERKRNPDLPGWEDTFKPPEDEKLKPGKKRLREDMEEFFEELREEAKKKGLKKRRDGDPAEKIYLDDIERAEKGSEEVRSEYETITRKRVDEKDMELADFSPVITLGDPSALRDERFKQRMRQKLKEWKTGHKVTFGKTGTQFSVESWIASGGRKPFVKVRRRSVKGQKYLFVVDFSGSIAPFEQQYEKALVNALDVIDGIGGKIAVFAFGATRVRDRPVEGFFKVKTFEEGRWRPSHAAKLVSIKADGSTPLAPTYQALERYIKRHRPTYVITVTDGDPDSWFPTKEMIEKLKRNTRMVAFGISSKALEKHMLRKLRELGYHKSFVVSDLNQLPEKLVDLIAPIS